VSDWFLIVAPLFLLVVVLFLGFAGCDAVFGLGPITPVEPPKPLKFSVQVVIPLTVLGDVTFLYLRPSQTMLDTATATPEANNVFAFSFDEREIGNWMVSCKMTGELDGVQETITSNTGHFILPDSGNWVLPFVASGTPRQDFTIEPMMLEMI
jgi:hypothetical protein